MMIGFSNFLSGKDISVDLDPFKIEFSTDFKEVYQDKSSTEYKQFVTYIVDTVSTYQVTMHIHTTTGAATYFKYQRITIEKYCGMPARQGLQRTALAPGSDKTRTRDPLCKISRQS